MKIVRILFIAGIALSRFGIVPATASEKSAAQDVAAAKSLAFGGVGVAGLMSEGERNLRTVLEQPAPSQELQAAFAHATAAGKLYILVGLHRCDRAAYQKVFNSVGDPEEAVEVVRGCMISKKHFVRSAQKFKMVDSIVICHNRLDDCQWFFSLEASQSELLPAVG